MMVLIIKLILWCLGWFSNGIQDTIAFNFNYKTALWNRLGWDKKYPKLYEWLISDWKIKSKYVLKIPFTSIVLHDGMDGWHFFKSLSMLLFAEGIIYGTFVFSSPIFHPFVLFVMWACGGGTFKISKEHIFTHRKKEFELRNN